MMDKRLNTHSDLSRVEKREDRVETRSEAHRLRTASPIRVTISLSIAAGVAKLSRANPA
jgi:hypothetical protein